MDRPEKLVARLEEEVGKLASVRPRPVVAEFSVVDREGVRLVKKWVKKCGKRDRDYCRSILAGLVRYYTPESIDALLTEALRRRRDIKGLLDLLKDCRPGNCNWDAVRAFLGS